MARDGGRGQALFLEIGEITHELPHAGLQMIVEPASRPCLEALQVAAVCHHGIEGEPALSAQVIAKGIDVASEGCRCHEASVACRGRPHTPCERCTIQKSMLGAKLASRQACSLG